MNKIMQACPTGVSQAGFITIKKQPAKQA